MARGSLILGFASVSAQFIFAQFFRRINCESVHRPFILERRNPAADHLSELLVFSARMPILRPAIFR